MLKIVLTRIGEVPEGLKLVASYIGDPENLWRVSLTDNGTETGELYFVHSLTRKVAVTSSAYHPSIQIADVLPKVK